MNHDIDLLVAAAIQESLKVKQALLNDKDILSLIATVAKEFVTALKHGHKILLSVTVAVRPTLSTLLRSSWVDSKWSERLSLLSR